GAIITAVSTTIVSFIPVFTLQAAEGKLFRPLAFTKTYALIAAVIIALFVLPAIARTIYGWKFDRRSLRTGLNVLLLGSGLWILLNMDVISGILIMALAAAWIFEKPLLTFLRWPNVPMTLLLILITWVLSIQWLPLGPEPGEWANFLFVGAIIALILGGFQFIIRRYERMLSWALDHRTWFLSIPLTMIILGLLIGIGFPSLFGGLAKTTDRLGVNIRQNVIWSTLAHTFPGIGSEFMPALDEGSFLLMPTSMPHAGIEQNHDILRILDRSVEAIPEVEMVVGKLGRVESALDPAPISMYENIISYKPEYISDEAGHPIRFKIADKGYITRQGDTIDASVLRQEGISRYDLVEDEQGEYFRNWRPEIRYPDDIWQRIAEATRIPGVTSAPKLQPIETRLVMLQTGMRAPMGIKIFGHDLDTIERLGLEFENLLKDVPGVKDEAVFADRIVGKPYLELDIDRKKASRYGLSVKMIQQAIESAIGGMSVSQTVEGRERYAIRVRYPRGLRDTPDDLKEILISTPEGVQIPLGEVVSIKYEKGPQSIKSENGFLVGYVLFDKLDGFSEVEVVNAASRRLDQAIGSGEVQLPSGVSFAFSGSYENQVRASKRLSFVIPIVLVIIFLILYFQFRSVAISTMVFTGVAVAFSGGFIMLWLYGHPDWWDWGAGGFNIGEVFNMHTIYLSVAVWVGFIALFGIATDDGVVMATYLKQQFDKRPISSKKEIRKNIIAAGSRRVRPCLMTTATTLIALLPVLSSQGRGSDIMIPMAIPAFGGMVFEVITLFVVPVLYSIWYERKISRS
ncbi:MAG: efflux RND transporter permease subunit, partial [Bacteroidota bacterium]|nr:efflux RND transporter permease subunit [Bacteroidota bacterium]